MHEDIGSLNILVDKLERDIVELGKLLLGRVIDRQVQIAGNVLFGVIEEEASACSHDGSNLIFSVKKLHTRKQRKTASSIVVGDKNVSRNTKAIEYQIYFFFFLHPNATIL